MTVHCLYKVLATSADNPLNGFFNAFILEVFPRKLPPDIVCAMRNNLTSCFKAFNVLDHSIKCKIIQAYILDIKSYINYQTDEQSLKKIVVCFKSMNV